MEIPEMLTANEVAKALRIKPQTLAKWRLQGRNLAFIKAGSRVLYDVAEVQRFITRQTLASTAADQGKEQKWAGER
jgi:predicted site-specific integrase-resolvase